MSDSLSSSPLSSARSDISVPSDLELDHHFTDTHRNKSLKLTNSRSRRPEATTPSASELSKDHFTPQVSVKDECSRTSENEDQTDEKRPAAVETSSDHLNEPILPQASTNDTPQKADATLELSAHLLDELQEDIPASRPKRTRKAPQKHEEVFEIPNSPIQAKRLPRAAREPNYTPNYILTNPKSILGDIDLDKLFSNEQTWDVLSREAQARLLGMLPHVPQASDFPGDEPLPNIPKELLRSNSAFKTDLRIFQEDLKSGRLNERWRREAAEAMIERAEGTFDEWKNEEREEFWGQKMRGTNGDV